jgi:hypothetical protein
MKRICVSFFRIAVGAVSLLVILGAILVVHSLTWDRSTDSTQDVNLKSSNGLESGQLNRHGLTELDAGEEVLWRSARPLMLHGVEESADTKRALPAQGGPRHEFVADWNEEAVTADQVGREGAVPDAKSQARDLASMLEGVDMSDPAMRERVVRQVRKQERAEREVVVAKARRLGLALRGCGGRSESPSNRAMWNPGVEHARFLPDPFKNRPSSFLRGTWHPIFRPPESSDVHAAARIGDLCRRHEGTKAGVSTPGITVFRYCVLKGRRQASGNGPITPRQIFPSGIQHEESRAAHYGGSGTPAV